METWRQIVGLILNNLLLTPIIIFDDLENKNEKLDK